jgi:hypothetical protein
MTAEFYRERAAEYRRLAAEIIDSDHTAQLFLATAEEFEALAKEAEQKQNAE